MADAILAVFQDPATAAAAIHAARGAGAAEVRARMPAPFPEVLSAIGRGRSPLGILTLTGAFSGFVGGFLLCIVTSLAWPLVVGGKPIVAIQSFSVIGFEVTVLVAVLVTMGGLGALVTRTRTLRPVPADPRFSHDCIGVLVFGGEPGAIEAVLKGCGATEVSRV
ncbi:MAG TPA: quinol:electron acceptor oxidoreductase subunit ActD [bacterium]|nr:quinol:electron acceptor oxidoreductase subunit ActD [bacterium]